MASGASPGQSWEPRASARSPTQVGEPQAPGPSVLPSQSIRTELDWKQSSCDSNTPVGSWWCRQRDHLWHCSAGPIGFFQITLLSLPCAKKVIRLSMLDDFFFTGRLNTLHNLDSYWLFHVFIISISSQVNCWMGDGGNVLTIFSDRFHCQLSHKVTLPSIHLILVKNVNCNDYTH